MKYLAGDGKLMYTFTSPGRTDRSSRLLFRRAWQRHSARAASVCPRIVLFSLRPCRSHATISICGYACPRNGDEQSPRGIVPAQSKLTIKQSRRDVITLRMSIVKSSRAFVVSYQLCECTSSASLITRISRIGSRDWNQTDQTFRAGSRLSACGIFLNWRKAKRNNPVQSYVRIEKSDIERTTSGDQ